MRVDLISIDAELCINGAKSSCNNGTSSQSVDAAPCPELTTKELNIRAAVMEGRKGRREEGRAYGRNT
jgi:hypothetical protein